ncbi:ABC transporter ATP-binding protein [bacterium]|nr:ABC transporter ATP-binding protein [bacterium]
MLALRNIDFAAKKGEFIAIMGPSGSGKSTFLNVLGGLDAPSFGKVLVKGRDISRYTEEQVSRLRRETIGSIFQSQDLFPALTALENVEFPLLLAGAEPGARREAAKNMLERVGLADRMEYLPEELSGGQRQRVGIARALIRMPSIVLADEPTGQLDTATSREIVDLLASLVSSSGMTLIVVTHDSKVADRAHRALFMRDGVLSKEIV